MTTSESLYALAAQAAEMDGLARAADVLATDLPNEGNLEQKDALTGVARSLATLLRQHTEALDKLAVASRGAKWEAPHHPAHGDALTIHSLCETALQADNDGHDVTALLTVLKEKAGALVDVLEGA